MILLDTNVLSELTRRRPDPQVMAWLDSLDAGEVATTAITAAELLHGVDRLPDGQRKATLAAAVRDLLSEDLGQRVEPFDVTAAGHYARVVTGREKHGRPIGVADAQIAAICRKFAATLATGNTRDFEGTGVELVDPWRERS